MKNTLIELKEELFDAPEDVKEAFNIVLNYFSSYNPKRSYSADSVVVCAKLEDPERNYATVKVFKYPGNTPISETRKSLLDKAKKDHPDYDIFIPAYEDNAKSIMEFLYDMAKDLYKFRY